MLMKKIMMIAAMMVAAVSANAQFEPGTFSIQPKAGATISWLSNMPSNSEVSKAPTVGAIFGAEAEYQLTEQFSVAAGVNYAQQGSGFDDYSIKYGDYESSVKDIKYELGYINVPVVANFYVFKGFAIKAGIQCGFLASAKFKYTASENNAGNKKTVDFDEDIKDECSKFDLSVPLGVSYQVPTVPIVIDMRYNLGLLKVNKESEAGHDDMKNNMIQLTVGYKFAL